MADLLIADKDVTESKHARMAPCLFKAFAVLVHNYLPAFPLAAPTLNNKC